MAKNESDGMEWESLRSGMYLRVYGWGYDKKVGRRYSKEDEYYEGQVVFVPENSLNMRNSPMFLIRGAKMYYYAELFKEYVSHQNNSRTEDSGFVVAITPENCHLRKPIIVDPSERKDDD